MFQGYGRLDGDRRPLVMVIRLLGAGASVHWLAGNAFRATVSPEFLKRVIDFKWLFLITVCNFMKDLSGRTILLLLSISTIVFFLELEFSVIMGTKIGFLYFNRGRNHRERCPSRKGFKALVVWVSPIGFSGHRPCLTGVVFVCQKTCI